MPKLSPNGIKGLYKNHERRCRVARNHPEQCACSWKGNYKGHRVVLAKWAGIEVDPHSVAAGAAMLQRLRVTVDAHNRQHELVSAVDPQSLLTGLSEADIEKLMAIASLMRKGRQIKFTAL